MLISFVIFRKHAGGSGSDVPSCSSNNHNVVVVAVTWGEHDNRDFHVLFSVASKDGRVEATVKFKEEHCSTGCYTMVFPSPEVGKTHKAPIVFYPSLKVEFFPEVFIIANAFVPRQPSKKEWPRINLRGSDLNRLYDDVSAIPVHHSKAGGQIFERGTDQIYRGFSVSDHKCRLFSLLVELMVHKVRAYCRCREANPSRKCRNPIAKAVLFRLRPRQPTWLRGGTKLVKLAVVNRSNEHQSEKSVSEIPASPVGSIFFALHPFALWLLIRKLPECHNVLQPRWSVA